MRIIFMIIIMIIAANYNCFGIGMRKSIKSPDVIYCETMGYKVEFVADDKGITRGFCTFSDGTIANSMEFFQGKVGEKWSYGYQHGYHVKNKVVDKGPYQIEYATCIKSQSNNVVEEIPQIELMKNDNVPSYKDLKTEGLHNEVKSNYQPVFVFQNSGFLPPSFDWRNRDSHSYIGSVRNQENCGSCYAFAACAAAECSYNWANQLYDQNCKDFSEAFIMWCLGRYGPYDASFGGCDGATQWDYDELDALRTIGIIDEAAMPYDHGNDPGSCNYGIYSTVKFQSWNRVECSDYEAIREAIYNYGAVDASIFDAGDPTFQTYKGGIYLEQQNPCSENPCYYTFTNHSVSLIGWGTDPDYGDYWILRNSWDPDIWGDHDYMKISVASALVSCEVAYLIPVPAGPVCGNGICEAGETYNNCPSDCVNPNTYPICLDKLSRDGFMINGQQNGISEVCIDHDIILSPTFPNPIYPPIYCPKNWFRINYTTMSGNCDDLDKNEPNPIDCHHHFWNHSKCDCHYWQIFISIQECDCNGSPIGTEHDNWVNLRPSECHWYYIGSFNLNEYLPQLGVTLQSGKYYRLKLADNYWEIYYYPDPPPWDEYTRIIHTFEDNVYINGTTINNDIYGKNIVLENVTVNNYIKVIAGQQISILPYSSLRNGIYRIDETIGCDHFAGKSSSLLTKEEDVLYNTEEIRNEDFQGDEIKPMEKVNTEIKFLVYPEEQGIHIVSNLTSDNHYLIVVYDMIGKEIISTTFSGLNKSSEISNVTLRSGVYIYQIIGDNKINVSGKFVITK